MDAFPVEMLRSERHRDLLWHAAYPTATRSLCGRLKEQQVRGHRERPTCAPCLTAAVTFRRIDLSAPASWVAA